MRGRVSSQAPLVLEIECESIENAWFEYEYIPMITQVLMILLKNQPPFNLVSKRERYVSIMTNICHLNCIPIAVFHLGKNKQPLPVEVVQRTEGFDLDLDETLTNSPVVMLPPTGDVSDSESDTEIAITSELNETVIRMDESNELQHSPPHYRIQRP